MGNKPVNRMLKLKDRPMGAVSSENFELFEEEVLDIWNGKKMEEFRSRVNTNKNMNEECKTCSYCKIKSPKIKEGNVKNWYRNA